MRVYTRACCDKARGDEKLAKGYARALELRQLSICGFVGQDISNKTNSNRNSNSKKKRKSKQALREEICKPPAGLLEDIERGGLGLVSWTR